MLMELLQRLETEWAPVLAKRGVKLCAPLQLIKIGDPAAQAQKLTALVFDAASEEPLMVLKVAEGETYRRFLLAEYQALTTLALQAELKDAVPSLLAFFEHDGILVLLESVLPGVSLLESLQTRARKRAAEVDQDLRRACDFLLRLRAVTCLNQVLPPVDMRARLATLEAIYGPLGLSSERLAWIREQERVFNASRILRSACHGDYWPGNMLLTSAGVGVVDWEGYRETADPFFDLFFFVTTYILSYPWHGWRDCPPEDAFTHGFLEENWLSNMVREHLLNYFVKLNLDPELMAFVYQNFLLEMSLPGAIEYDPRRPPQYEQWFSFYQSFMNSPFNVFQ